MPQKADQLSYFQVKYGNSSSERNLVCGTAPSLEASETSVEYVNHFTLYCEDPQVVRSLEIKAEQSQFELCEVKVSATRAGKNILLIFSLFVCNDDI